MISRIVLNQTAGKSEKLFEFEPKRLNIIVGPNNSGKSTFLNELNDKLNYYNMKNQLSIKELEFTKSNEELHKEILAQCSEVSDPREYNLKIMTLNGIQGATYKSNYLTNDRHYLETATQAYLGRRTAFLNGQDRFHLISKKELNSYDKDLPAANIFEFIFKDEDKYKKLREYFYKTFGYYLYFDPTSQFGSLKLVISKEEYPEGSSLHDFKEFHNFIKKGRFVEELSDGMKCIIGLLIAVLFCEEEVLIIDEPEAFLSRDYQLKLGMYIAEISKIRNKQLFVSTHSSSFLKGVSSKELNSINILRFTEMEGRYYTNSIQTKDLKEIVQNPRFKHADLLNSLFYSKVIITEGHSDTIFYGEIINLFAEKIDANKFEDTLVICTYSDNQIINASLLLSKLEIPNVSIYDFDILLKDSGVFKDLINKLSINSNTKNIISTVRSHIKDKDLKNCGLKGLNSEDKISIENNILCHFASQRKYIVPIGELEDWEKSFKGNNNSKDLWLSNFLKTLESPTEISKIFSNNHPIFNFLKKIQF